MKKIFFLLFVTSSFLQTPNVCIEAVTIAGLFHINGNSEKIISEPGNEEDLHQEFSDGVGFDEKLETGAI